MWTPVTFLICYALVLSHKSQTLSRIYTSKCWNSFLFCSFTTQRSELSLNKFVCLFGGFSSHSRIFHLYGDVTIAGEGLQILTYARHSWPLSSEGSLACHTYCDTGHPFIMVICQDPLHFHLAVTTCFYDLGLSWPGIEPQSPARKAKAIPLRHRGGH